MNFLEMTEIHEILSGFDYEKLQNEIEKFAARAEIIKNLIIFKDEKEKLEVEKISKILNEFVEKLREIPNNFQDFKNFTDEKFLFLSELQSCAEKYKDRKNELQKLRKILPYIPFCQKKIIENAEIKFILSKMLKLEQEETSKLRENFIKFSLDSLLSQNHFFHRQLSNKLETLRCHHTQKLFEVEETSIRTMKFLQNSMREYHEKSKEMTKLFDSKSESYELKIQKVSNELRIFNELEEKEIDIFNRQQTEIFEYQNK